MVDPPALNVPPVKLKLPCKETVDVPKTMVPLSWVIALDTVTLAPSVLIVPLYPEMVNVPMLTDTSTLASPFLPLTPSKITVCVEVGIEAPLTPPDTMAQFVVSLHAPAVLPTQ